MRRLWPDCLFLQLFFLTLLVGIWYALPLTDVVPDEWPYVGGVLRALESHTLIPNIDYSYTLSFYANFIAMAGVVFVMLVTHSFDVVSTQYALVAHYDLLYLVPRFVSVLASLGIALLLVRFGRDEGHSPVVRVAAAGLILTNIIGTALMHTGTMWPLSAALLSASIYWFSRVVRTDTWKQVSWWKSDLFWSIGFSFLAFANFPFNMVALLQIPALLILRKTWFERVHIIRYSVVWAAVFGILFLINLKGWQTQQDVIVISLDTITASLSYHLWTFVALFPLITFVFVMHIRSLRNHPVFFLILAELGAYITLHTLLVPWTATSTDFYRYSFVPLILFGFLLLCLDLGSVPWKRMLFYGAVGLSCVFFCKTLYLLALPTTYNNARNWIIEHVTPSEVVVHNTLVPLSLPKNPASYALTAPDRCSSLCQVGKMTDLTPGYRYIIIDDETDPTYVSRSTYRISRNAFEPGFERVAQFENGIEGSYELNHRLGVYSLDFLMAKRLGLDVYIHHAQ